MKYPLGKKIALFVLSSMVAALAMGERDIALNGRQLTPEQVDWFDQLACQPMANGKYWFDPSTGVWGYEGDKTMRGRLLGQCDQASSPSTTPGNAEYYIANSEQ